MGTFRFYNNTIHLMHNNFSHREEYIDGCEAIALKHVGDNTIISGLLLCSCASNMRTHQL